MATTAPPNPLPPDHNIGPILTIISCVFIVPTAITTALRLWVRIRGRTSGADDYTMIAATALAITLSALSIKAVQEGKGRHVWYLSDYQIQEVSKLSWANQVVLFCALCMIKTSICLLILRIKETRTLKWIVYTTIALLAVSNLLPIIALCVECSPVYGFWRRTAAGVTCRPPDFRIYSIYVQSAYSIFTDLLCSVLPVIIVWQLQLSKKKKIGVCILMSMGLVCTAFAGLRAASLSTDITDTTWTYTYTGIWMTIELNLGIVAANLAPLRALIVKIFPTLQSRNTYPHQSSLPTYHNSTRHGPRLDPYDENAVSISANKRTRQRDSSSFTSDRSQIPLKDVLHTKEVRVEYGEAQSGSDTWDNERWRR